MRWRAHQYGIHYLSSSGFHIPKQLKVGGAKKPFEFDASSGPEFMYEFREICINDCYQLHTLKKIMPEVKTIVDIGANQGLFTLAARQFFAKARIECYEPNGQLKDRLSHNAQMLGAQVYYEAATQTDCRMELEFDGSDLHTQAKTQQEGSVQGRAFKKIIERAGGSIDILKMDCEGGEWGLLEDRESWSFVNAITMEYHLWAKPGSKVETIIEILTGFGFEILHHQGIDEKFGLMTAIRK